MFNDIFAEKRKIVDDGYDPHDPEDLKQWQLEQAMQKTQRVFSFFFQQSASEREEDSRDATLDFFRLSSRVDSLKRKVQPQRNAENFLKEFQNHNFDNLNDFVKKQSHETFYERGESVQHPKHQNPNDDSFRQKNFGFQRDQQVHKYFKQSHPHQAYFQKTEETSQHHRQQKKTSGSQNLAGRARQDEKSTTQDNHFEADRKTFNHQSFTKTRKNTQESAKSYQTTENIEKQHQASVKPQQPESKKKIFNSQHTKKTKAKVSFKRKRSTANQEMAKRFTKGTDGKWYFKGDDGRWKVHDGPPQGVNKSKKKRSKTGKVETETDQRKQEKQVDQKEQKHENFNKIYVQDKGGNWYVKVDSPFGRNSPKGKDAFQQEDLQDEISWKTQKNQQANRHHKSSTGNTRDSTRFSSSQYGRDVYDYERDFDVQRRGSHHFQKSSYDINSESNRRQRTIHYSAEANGDAQGLNQNLPRGLFVSKSGKIFDRLGNIYYRLPTGQLRVQHLARANNPKYGQAHVQNRRKEKEKSDRTVFHDSSGNLYVKDENGNLIKVHPSESKRKQFQKESENPRRRVQLNEEIHKTNQQSRKYGSNYRGTHEEL